MASGGRCQIDARLQHTTRQAQVARGLVGPYRKCQSAFGTEWLWRIQVVRNLQQVFATSLLFATPPRNKSEEMPLENRQPVGAVFALKRLANHWDQYF